MCRDQRNPPPTLARWTRTRAMVLSDRLPWPNALFGASYPSLGLELCFLIMLVGALPPPGICFFRIAQPSSPLSIAFLMSVIFLRFQSYPFSLLAAPFSAPHLFRFVASTFIKFYVGLRVKNFSPSLGPSVLPLSICRAFRIKRLFCRHV